MLAREMDCYSAGCVCGCVVGIEEGESCGSGWLTSGYDEVLIGIQFGWSPTNTPARNVISIPPSAANKLTPDLLFVSCNELCIGLGNSCSSFHCKWEVHAKIPLRID